MVTSNRHVAAAKDEYILGNAINIKCVFLMKSQVKIFYHNQIWITGSSHKPPHNSLWCEGKPPQWLPRFPHCTAGSRTQDFAMLEFYFRDPQRTPS